MELEGCRCLPKGCGPTPENRSPELWDHNSAPGTGAGLYRLPLTSELSARRLVPDPQLQPRILSRIEHFGRLEAAHLSVESVPAMSAAKVRWALGSGFTMTEFLIAPVLGAASPPEICSLGALVNLMVVLCDRLLDAGTPLDEVLPLSGGSSPVFNLLDTFRTEFAALQPTESFHALSEKLIARMIGSERQTAIAPDRLPYRHWLRKSALPFVLMALPAWTCRKCAASGRPSIPFSAHLQWLCRLGRFFGVVDDAADYERDLVSGQPNYFRPKSPDGAVDSCHRAAARCAAILGDWHRLAGDSPKAVIFKETFLNLTWSWLQPASTIHP